MYYYLVFCFIFELQDSSFVFEGCCAFFSQDISVVFEERFFYYYFFEERTTFFEGCFNSLGALTQECTKQKSLNTIPGTH